MMAEPIRVAQVMGYMNGGGVESVVMNYYRHIDRNKIQFDFLVCEGSTMVPEDEIDSLGGGLYMLPPYSDLIGYQRAVFHLCSERGWPLVHSHMNSLSVIPLSAAKKAGVPVRIAHSHSTSGKGEYAKNVLKRILRTQANRYPTERLACSRAAGEWLFGSSGKFEVLYNAFDLNRFILDPVTREKTREECGIGANQLAVLHVGRFMTQKNHGFLIDAFNCLADQGVDAILILVGEGEGRPAIEAKVRGLGLEDRVLFLGQRDDVEKLYMAADVFVLPSLYEGLGMVAVEAQVAGLPCFLSDVITREVDVSGACQFLPIDNYRKWATELGRIHLGERLAVNRDSFSHYEICTSARVLTEFYIEKYKEAFD